MDDQRKAERDKLLTELLRIGKRHPEIARRLAALAEARKSRVAARTIAAVDRGVTRGKRETGNDFAKRGADRSL